MATLRDLAPGTDGQLSSLAPGLTGVPVDALPVNYAPDTGPMLRDMERDSSSQTGLSFKSTLASNKANYLASEEAVRRAAGDVAGADSLRQQVAAHQQEAAFWAPREQKVEDLNWEPGRIADWAAGAVGNVAGSVVDPMAVAAGLRGAAAVAGLSKNPLAQAISRSGNSAALAGGFGVNFASNMGDTYNRMVADPHTMANTTPTERALGAGGAGLVMGGLDMLPQAGILKNLGILKGARAQGTILGNTAKGMAMEAGTEGVQTGVQIGAHYAIDQGRDSGEDFSNVLNAVAAGGVGSGPMAGAGAVANAMRNRVAEPGEPGTQRGDDINLSTGQKVDAPDFETDLKQRGTPEWQQTADTIRARQDLFEGVPPEDANTDEAMSAWTAARRDAIVEELDKAGDEKSKEFSARLKAADLNDPVALGDHELVMDEAADHVRPRAGMDDAGIERLVAAANKRKKNERLFAPQDHIELKGEQRARAGTVSSLMTDLLPEETRAKRGVDKFLTSIGRELTSMGMIESDGPAKRTPSEGEVQRAARLGTIVGSMMQGNTEKALQHVAKAANIPDGKLLQAFTEHAKLHSGKMTPGARLAIQKHQADTADRVVDLIPPIRVNAMQKKGVNVYDDNVKTHLLDGLQRMFDGDESLLTQTKAVEMFGAEAVSEMKKLIGVRLTAEEVADGADEVTEFDKATAQRGVEKAPATSIIFGRGMTERGGVSISDMFRKKKGRELPSMIHMPEGATKEQAAQQRSTLAAIFRDVKKAPGIGPVEGVRSGHSISIRKVSDLMDEQGVPGTHRESLMREYLLKEHNRAIEGRAKEIAEERGWSKKTALTAARQEANDDNSPLGQLRANVTREAHLQKLVAALNARVGTNTPNTRANLKQLVEGADAATKALLAKVAKQASANEMKNQAATPEAVVAAKAARDAVREDGGTGADANDAAVEALKFVLGAPTDKLSMAAKAVTQLLAETQEASAKAVLAAVPGGAKQYFGERRVVVASRRDAWDNKDHLAMTHTEFKDMLAAAKPALDAARKMADPAAANKQLSEEGVLFVSAAGRSEGTPVAIKAKHIAAWARNGEFSSTTTDDSVKNRASDRAKRREYISLLVQGISEMMRQQYITALPAVLGPDGEYQTFSQPRDRKVVEADRTRELDKAKDDFERRQVDRKYDAELRLKGLPPALMLDNGQTAEQFVLDGWTPVNSDLADAMANMVRTAKGVERIDSTQKALRAIKDERREQRRDDARDETKPITEEGFLRGDPAEDGTQADVDEQEHAARTNAVMNATEFSDTRYNKDSAFREAKRVGEELWQQLVMRTKHGARRIKAIHNSLLKGELHHAPPLAALIAQTRIGKRRENMSEKDVAYLDRIAGSVIAVVSEMKPSEKRGQMIEWLAGRTFQTDKAAARWLEDNADWSGFATDFVPGPTHTARELNQRTEINRMGPRFAPVQQVADPARAEKATINERRAQKLEAELAEIEARLAELQKVLAPIAEAKATGEAKRDTAAFASSIVDADNAKAEGKMFVGTDPRAPSRSSSKDAGRPLGVPTTDGAVTTFKTGAAGVKAKPLTPAQVRAARVAAAAAHQAKLTEARAKYKALVDAAGGMSKVRGLKQELDALSTRKAEAARELDAMEARDLKPAVAIGRVDPLGADGAPKIPGDKGPKTTPAQRKAERLAPKAEPTTAAPAGQGFNIVQLPFGASKSGVFDGHRAGSKNVTNAAPGAPGALGNPFVASDVRGTTSRKEAVAKFKEAFLKRVNSDPEYRGWVLTLRGKDVGYYKPDEADIHLHVVQEWLAQQSDAPAPERKMVTRKAKDEDAPTRPAGVQVRESASSGYATRTKHNADAAGATVAIAADFTTAGEKLTARVAGKKLLKIDIFAEDGEGGADLAAHMKRLGTSTLNVAGNGIYTLAQHGVDQTWVNKVVHGIIAEAHAIHPITLIVSGGQTGVDIAGAIAAKALGIPAEITLPVGYVQRGVDKVDRQHTRAEIGKQIIDGAAALTGGGAVTAQATKPATDVAAAIQKRQDYLDNPPADYTTEKAERILDWAERALGRANDLDSNERAEAGLTPSVVRSLERLVAKAESVLEGDESLREFEGTGRPAQKMSNRDFGAKKAPDTVSQPTPSDADLKAVQAVLTKLLGPGVKAAYSEHLDAAGEWISGTKTVHIGRAAIGSLNNMLSVGFHEAMHGFFSEVLKENPKAREMLESALNTDVVNQRLKELLAGEDAALAAIERDPEERVAYAFEFWSQGLLGAGPKTAGFFARVQRFLRAVFQGISEQEKALEIFQALYDGKMAQPGPAARALHKAMTRGEKIQARKEKADAQLQWARSMAVASHRRLTGEDTVVGKEIAYAFFKNPGSTKGGTDPGILNRTRNEMNRRSGAFTEIMAKLDDGERKQLAMLDNAKTDSATLPEGKVRTALEDLYKFNADMYRYLTSAGLEIGVRDDGRYTPMVWDMQYMIENEGKFTAMLLEHYRDKMDKAASTMPPVVVKSEVRDRTGKVTSRAETRPATAQDAADALHQLVIDRSGLDGAYDAQREDGVLTPFFASENTRALDWIAPEHRKEFLSEDIIHKMTGYIRQGVRAAEYTRTWGVGGKLLQNKLQRKGDVQGVRADGTSILASTDGDLITQLREAAVRAKVPEDKQEMWVERRFDAMKRSVGAMEGVLGKDISDNMRRLNNGAMVYQNIRLLPLSLFAAMLDPNGIMVSGGSLNDALYAYVRGMKSVVKAWMALAKGGDIGLDRDADEAAAITVGSVDSNVFLERMGAAQVSEYVGGTARKINNKFFLLNGLSMWDRSMRIAATRAGMSFILKHAAGHNEHSERFLKDLGLTAEDVVTDSEGRLVIDANQLANIYARKAAGDGWADATPEMKKNWVVTRRRKAEKDVAKVHAAVNRFVERSILSPNAAQRPTWSSDPHYAALFHLKQYTYSFQETIMQHVAEEAEHGNYQPGLQILAGVPIMIAADIVKGLVTGGGSLPGYMANWNMGDWFMHAWGRAGLLGVGQIGLDAIERPSTLFGPSVDQLVQTAMHPMDKLESLDMVPGVRMFRKTVQDVTGAVGL